MRRVRLLILFLFIALAGSIEAQNFDGGFSFYLPPDDSTEQEFMPAFRQTIDRHGFVTVDGQGHFAVHGQRIRFFGTNLVADACFPPKDKAPWIAARLRKMGFNLVRLHHMDNPWSAGSLFEQGSDTRHLNPVTLDRLDFLLAHLKRVGIRVNVNLHVSRTFRREDGVPYADSIRDFGKGVTLFDPILIDLQKEYARQLLTHVNPYTGLSLVNDPVMAIVEITNENSLYYMWRQGMLRPTREGGTIPAYHARMLDSLWCDFLASKYGSTEALRAAWGEGESHPGRDLIRGGDIDSDPMLRHWQLELHSPARATQTLESNNPAEGRLCVRVTVSQSDGVDWHVQWQYRGLSVKKDSTYALVFMARADRERTIPAVLMKDASPWTTYAYGTFRVGPQWQTYLLGWRPDGDYGSVRVSFFLGAESGTTWFDDVHLYEGYRQGLDEGESLEERTVRRIPFTAAGVYSDARVQDQTEFYIRLQDAFFDEMERYLRQELGVRVPIVRTNWNFGLVDLYVQSQADYVDNHAYWDHPQFPHEPWSPTDWLIDNTAMVLDQDGGTIGRLFAGRPMAGKPYTVSEYDHPFPNRYHTEGPLFLTAYAAFHDIDGLMFFDYSSEGVDWETDMVRGFFSDHRNTAIMAHMPTLSLAYLGGFITPAQRAIELKVNYSHDVLLEPRKGTMGWEGSPIVDPHLALLHAVRIGTFDGPTSLSEQSLPQPAGPPYVSDTGEIQWDPTGILSVASDRFLGLTGFLDRFSGTDLGTWKLVAADGFATVSAVPLDSLPFSKSRRILLALTTRVQNYGMVWDGTRTVHDRWGGPPTFIEPRRLTLELATEADSVRVVPLGRSGEADYSHSWLAPKDGTSFRIELNQERDRTVWYGIRVNRNSSAGSGPTPQNLPDRFQLRGPYPNPWSPNHSKRNQSCSLQLSLPSTQELALRIYDALGRSVLSAKMGVRGPGDVRLDLGQIAPEVWELPSGLYFVQVESVNGNAEVGGVRKWIVIR